MIHRVLRARAEDAARFARVLGGQDPAWRSETFELAGGHVALWGDGSYVNRAIAVGIDQPVTADDFELLEVRSAAVGVDAAIEMTALTDPGVRVAAVSRGYVRSGSVSALRRSLDDVDDPSVVDDAVVESAAGQLVVWQATSALGWGHVTAGARRASDAFAAAAAVVDGDGFVLARDAVDGRPIGCASVTVNDEVATLGAMSTVPTARGRGVQAALIRRRLRFARSLGCSVAITTTAPGSASERNVRRHGFEPWFEIETWVRPTR